MKYIILLIILAAFLFFLFSIFVDLRKSLKSIMKALPKDIQSGDRSTKKKQIKTETKSTAVQDSAAKNKLENAKDRVSIYLSDKKLRFVSKYDSDFSLNQLKQPVAFIRQKIKRQH